MNDAQSFLPAKDELVDLINQAHADAQTYERNLVREHGWLAGHLQNEPLAKHHAYFLLRNLPAEYIHQVEEFGLEKISYEKALQEIKEVGRLPHYGTMLGLSVMGLAYVENGKDFVKGLASIPLAMASATVDIFLPRSVVAKRYMKNVNKTVDEHFQQFKEEIDKVFELYSEI